MRFLLLPALLALGYPTLAGQSSWDVPTEADQLANPVRADQDSLGMGSVIYAQRCAVCHGDRGEGDGPSALSLGVTPPNLRDPELMAQPDGRLFWKLSTGRGPMPNWQLVLSEQDIWHVINYIRAFSSH